MPMRSGYKVTWTEDRESLAEVIEDAIALSREFRGSSVVVWYDVKSSTYHAICDDRLTASELQEDAKEHGYELICVLRVPTLEG